MDCALFFFLIVHREEHKGSHLNLYFLQFIERSGEEPGVAAVQGVLGEASPNAKGESSKQKQKESWPSLDCAL
jgi:hypothetical protein